VIVRVMYLIVMVYVVVPLSSMNADVNNLLKKVLVIVSEIQKIVWVNAVDLVV